MRWWGRRESLPENCWRSKTEHRDWDWRELLAGSLGWTASLSWFHNIRLGGRWEQMFVIDRNLVHGSWHHENKNYSGTMWVENKMENHTPLPGWSLSITLFFQSGHNIGHIWEQEKKSSRRQSSARTLRHSLTPLSCSSVYPMWNNTSWCSIGHFGCTRHCTKWLWIFIHLLLVAKSLQSCPTLCDPIDGLPPGSPKNCLENPRDRGAQCSKLLW